MRFKEINQFFIRSLMTLKGVISLITNPNNTTSVYDIEDALMNQKSNQLSIQFIQDQPGVQEMAQERYLALDVDVDQLLQCPENSLGYQYASYLKEAGFDPHFYRDLKIKDDVSYLLMRRRQTHDIWHIITGFGADVASELGLKCFELAQTRSPMSALLVAGGLVKTALETPEELGYLLDRLAIGYRMGAKAKPFIAQKWEENWDKSVVQWRQELNVEVPQNYVP